MSQERSRKGPGSRNTSLNNVSINNGQWAANFRVILCRTWAKIQTQRFSNLDFNNLAWRNSQVIVNVAKTIQWVNQDKNTILVKMQVVSLLIQTRFLVSTTNLLLAITQVELQALSIRHLRWWNRISISQTLRPWIQKLTVSLRNKNKKKGSPIQGQMHRPFLLLIQRLTHQQIHKDSKVLQ